LIFVSLDSVLNFWHTQGMKRPSKKPSKDPNKLAYEIVRMSTEDLEEGLGGSQPKPKKPIKLAYKKEK